MEPSLEGCYIKLGRAKVHRDELKGKIGPVLDSIKEAVVTETTYQPDTEQLFLEIRYAPPINPTWSTLAGDAIHNLRSALDYLIYQAIWKINGLPWESGQFPIADAPSRFGDRDRAVFSRLGDYGAIVKRNQPFGEIDDLRSVGITGSNRAVLDVRRDNLKLALLRNLSNFDKHRLLLPGYVRAEDVSVITPGGWDREPSMYTTSIRLQPDTRIATWHAVPRDPDVQMHLDFRPSIGIGGGGDAIEVLDALSGKVLRLIREFEPLFKGRIEG